MPAYSYVSWQPDDEVTSTKLKQMADNEQNIFDTMLVGDATFLTGAGGLVPPGRTVGSVQAERVDGYYVAFDSGVAAARCYVEVVFNPVYTAPPICAATVKAAGEADYCLMMVEDSTATRAVYVVFRRDGAAVQLSGVIHVVAIGY